MFTVWGENTENITIAKFFKSNNLPYLEQRLIVVSDFSLMEEVNLLNSK
jgi:hypothetical protein